MKDLMTFFGQHIGLVIIVVSIACILLGRIWSDFVNRGEITSPELVIKKGNYYKVINTYIPTSWTEDWIVGSVICLKCYRKKLFVKYTKNIYVSGDRLRFTDNGPGIGVYYQATATKKATGTIVMKPMQKVPQKK